MSGENVCNVCCSETCRCYVALTKPQRTFLEECDWAMRKAFDGAGARGAKVRTASRLERLGLVEYVGHGRSEDDDNGDAEVPIYALTAAGRARLSPPSGNGDPK